jgi:hypothetical protein
MIALPKYLLLPLLPVLALAGCSVPQMRVDPDLRGDAIAWPVQGRNGWLVDQVLAFGPYRSGPVSRGWTKGYDYPFIVRFSGAREKLRFAVRDDAGNEAMVHCAGKLREQDLRAFRDYFDVNIKTTDTFTGTILLNEARSFDFHIENLNVQQNVGYKPLEGAVRGAGESIRLRAVWQTASGQRWLDTQPIGVEFLRDGSVIGAVETVNEGRVWIRDDLDGEVRMVLASLASALLLRSGLAEHNDAP